MHCFLAAISGDWNEVIEGFYLLQDDTVGGGGARASAQPRPLVHTRHMQACCLVVVFLMRWSRKPSMFLIQSQSTSSSFGSRRLGVELMFGREKGMNIGGCFSEFGYSLRRIFSTKVPCSSGQTISNLRTSSQPSESYPYLKLS